MPSCAADDGHHGPVEWPAFSGAYRRIAGEQVGRGAFLIATVAGDGAQDGPQVGSIVHALGLGLRGGRDERKLYTNADTIAYSLKRTGLFTGKIKPAGLETDAEERMIFLEFERMQTGTIRADDDLLDEFRRLHGGILGALAAARCPASGCTRWPVTSEQSQFDTSSCPMWTMGATPSGPPTACRWPCGNPSSRSGITLSGPDVGRLRVALDTLAPVLGPSG